MIGEYIKLRGKVILLVLLILLIFGSSYYLFDMPGITVLYPLLLSFVVLMIVAFVDYYKIWKLHQRLQEEIYENPTNLIEEDYQKIIEKLKEEEDIFRNRTIVDYNNMVEYYTVWAHQIKTPIASMRLNLQSEDSDLSRRLICELNRIESYVEMVLTFLRLDSDSTDYVIQEYDLDSMIRLSIRKFSREFILKKLSLDFQASNYKVLTDEKWLSFVLEQVISNAIKYTSRGGIQISMLQEGILYIEDSGIGIPAEDLPRIFENGYTGFNGREDKRASGIGLYLCYRICENLGHKIWAESELGVGTKIYLDLHRIIIGIE
ncbi:MAG: sensor histidine kinase [Eubacteriales bacterium]|nr:sensor histidine kinase [Eubacteriales bacterium]